MIIKRAAVRFLRDHMGVRSVAGYDHEFSKNGVAVTSFTHPSQNEGYVVLAPGSNGRVTRDDLAEHTETHRDQGHRIIVTAALYNPHAGFSWVKEKTVGAKR